MAAVNGSVRVDFQNGPARALSPSPPLVLSKPTTSRRKGSVSPSSQVNGGITSSLPREQVYSLNRQQQYSTSSLSRPLHSKYSASQPHLNVAGINVTLRSRSHTDGSHEQRNRWSIVGVEESPDSYFDSESLGKSYDLRLTKCSVEDLRPLPVPVVAPKVPPRKGSRLTTVPDPTQQQSRKVDHVKSNRETRSCEDLLESVSTNALRSNELHQNGNYMHSENHTLYSTYNQSQSQPQTPLVSSVEPQEKHWTSQGDNVKQITDRVASGIVASKMPMMSERSHSVGDECSNESEMKQVISNYSTLPRRQHNRADISNSANHSVSVGIMHNRAQLLQQLDQNLRTRLTMGQPNSAGTMPWGNSSNRLDYYQRSSPGAAPMSTEYSHVHNNPQGTLGSVSTGAYPTGGGMTRPVGQQSPTLTPIEAINDANRSMTPNTSCSSPSPSPHSQGDNTETVVINIPDNHQHIQDNKLTTSLHVPHYAIPVNSSTVPANNSVQGSSAIQGGHYSYGGEPNRALTPSATSDSQLHSNQSKYAAANSQEAMALKTGMKNYSLSQPTGNLSASVSPISSLSTEAQSQVVSQNTQILEQAFSRWQYNGTSTAKRKQGSGSGKQKVNASTEAKPPVKPKPASLSKGISLSLRRDAKSKLQKSPEGNKKSDAGKKYVFKPTRSRTLLARGRTPSQVDPLTDVGMDAQYGSYTPHKHNQSSPGSSGDSTLRADHELKFTDSQTAFSSSGPSPNSYDYGSQMTLTEDAALTPYSGPIYAPPTQYSAQSSQITHTQVHPTPGDSVSYSQMPNGSPSANASNATITSIIPMSEPTQARNNVPTPSPPANNGYSQLPNNGQIASSSPSDLKPTPHLAPIVEVNLESEQSSTSLLNTTEQNIASNSNVISGSSSSAERADESSDITQSQEADGKSVQRSTTLPSAYKRPKPYRFNPKKYVSEDIQEQADDSSDNELAFASSSIKLSDFTALNTSAFPKLVKLSNPITFTSGNISLSQSDVLNLHFVRQTKAAVVMSTKGEEYTIPLNSALRFSVTYDPLNSSQLVQQGYHFKSVGELIAMRQMPNVVVATESYIDSKPQSSVEAGEILVVCGIVKQAHGRVLKVNSISHGRKFLEERCTAKFSTRSDDTKLSLNDMFKASMPLPQQAVIHTPSGLHLPDSLKNAPVTLKRFCVVKSVIATPSQNQQYSPSSSTATDIYDISLTLDVEVRECSEDMDQYTLDMRPMTQHLYSSFDPTKVNPFYSSQSRSAEQINTQSSLLRAVDNKGKFLGMQLELPEWLGQMRINKAKRVMLQSQRESLSQPLLSHDHATGSASPDTEMRMASLEKYCRRIDIKVNTLVRSFTEVVQQISKLRKQQLTTVSDESDDNQGYEQYVEMMLSNVDPIGDRQMSSSPDKLVQTGDVRQQAEQIRQETSIKDGSLDGVKEWQKKQDKHLQWQQEQVQHWQIECEKQMQEMQEKLVHLEERQMKFFLETQLKLNQWKSDQERGLDSPTGRTHKQEQEEAQGAADGSSNAIPEKALPAVGKPYLPPKPSKNLQPIVSENKVTAVPTADKVIVKELESTESNSDSPDSSRNNMPASEDSTDFGLDMIASWCSQMELELNELYTNTMVTNQ